MKKWLCLLLATLCVGGMLVSCQGGDTSADTQPQETTLTETTGATSETLPQETPTLPAQTEAETEVETLEETQEETQEEIEYREQGEIFDLPNSYFGDMQLQGYEASGYFVYDEEFDALISDYWDNMIVVTNDSMASGKISVTLNSAFGDINDNGLIFGLEEFTEDEMFFWEDGPSYYFLFVSDASRLYLAKVAYQDRAWTELFVTEEPITDYMHGYTEITISVEFDGEGSIKCYANGECLIDYYDSDPLQGEGYGIRCEYFGVEYYRFVAEHD